MAKRKIKLVLLGNLRHKLDINRLRKVKSRFFCIDQIESILHLPEPKKDDGYLNIVYSRQEIIRIMSNINDSDIIIGIINYRFDDNFYLHRTGDNRACLSIADIDYLLTSKMISIENFIIKNIYEIVTFKDALNNLADDRVYQIVHQDTRGCLFDMNGDKFDVIYNTEKPVICDSCKAFFRGTSLPENYIDNLEKELKKIKRTLILEIELFIKKYPLFSILLTFAFSVLINIISSMIWEVLK